MTWQSRIFGLRLSAQALDATVRSARLFDIQSQHITGSQEVSFSQSTTLFGVGATLFGGLGPATLDVGVSRLWGDVHPAVQVKGMLGMAFSPQSDWEIRIRAGIRRDHYVNDESSGVAVEFELAGNATDTVSVALSAGGFLPALSRHGYYQPMMAAGVEYAVVGRNRGWRAREGELALQRADQLFTQLEELGTAAIYHRAAAQYSHLKQPRERRVYAIEKGMEYVVNPGTRWAAIDWPPLNDLLQRIRSSASYARDFGTAGQQQRGSELLERLGEKEEVLRDHLASQVATVIYNDAMGIIPLFRENAQKWQTIRSDPQMKAVLTERMARQRSQIEGLQNRLAAFQETYVIVAARIAVFRQQLECLLNWTAGCPLELKGASLSEFESRSEVP